MYNQNYADRVTYYVANSIIIATIVAWLSLSTPFDHPSNNRPFTERLYYRPAESFPIVLVNNENAPKAVFEPPLVLFCRALCPTAAFP